MVGINWLNLLFTKGHNCILADEMGMFALAINVYS